MSIVLDNTDKAILRELQEDGAISNLDLSKKIGLSPSACLTRTKIMIQLTWILMEMPPILAIRIEFFSMLPPFLREAPPTPESVATWQP